MYSQALDNKYSLHLAIFTIMIIFRGFSSFVVFLITITRIHGCQYLHTL